MRILRDKKFIIYCCILLGFLFLTAFNNPAGLIGVILTIFMAVWNYAKDRKTSEIRILRIEAFLEKGKGSTPKFFRPSGPQWVDFKEGFIVERKEVAEIIEKFKHTDLIILMGLPASGKSVILRNLGFRLANERKDVYIIELKGIPPAIEEFSKLRSGYLFIDDAHLNLAYIDTVVRKIAGNVKILISTRDIEARIGPTSSLKISEHFKQAFKIESQDVAGDIIQRFEEKKVVKIAEWELAEDNLWILAWQLEAYEKSRGQNIDDAVSMTIMDYVREDLGFSYGEDIFLFLSVFFRYEIPLRKEFIEELAENSETIEKLVKLDEINKISKDGFEYLAMHHSEVAEVFVRAFKRYEGFGHRIKEKIGTDWDEKLFHLYMQRFPDELVDIIFGLITSGGGIFNPPGEDDENPRSIFAKSILKKSFDKFVALMNKEIDIEKIGSCIQGISLMDDDKITRKLIESLNRIDLKEKIEKEANIVKIGRCISDIAYADKTLSSWLLNNIRIIRLADKIDTESDIFKIYLCIQGIYSSDVAATGRLFEGLDLENLENKMQDGNDISAIGHCIATIANINEGKEAAYKLIPILKNKMELETNIDELTGCVSAISYINKEFANNLVGRLDFKNLNSKIKLTDDIGIMNRRIVEIAAANRKVAQDLIRSNLEYLKHGLEEEKDNAWVGSCIVDVFNIAPEAGEKLAPIFENRIKMESDVRKIGEYFWFFPWKNNEDLLKILIPIIAIIKDRLREIEDIGEIGYYISIFSKIDKSIAKQLIDSLGIQKIISKISELMAQKDSDNVCSDADKMRAWGALELFECFTYTDEIRKLREKFMNYIMDIMEKK